MSSTQSKTETYMLSVLRGRRGVLPCLLRCVLWLLSWVYIAGLEAYLAVWRVGARKQTVLRAPVISIGNLTTGGTGKTPMTAMLCNKLKENGISAAVLNRGYGGESEYQCRVVSDGDKVRLSAREGGDEACMLARMLPGVPVVAGKDRRQTGQLALAQFRPDVLVLDDGMQYWQLHRDVEIILLDTRLPFDNGFVLPRGLLREPVWHLKRADIVVLTRSAESGRQQREHTLRRVRRLASGAPVFIADLIPAGLRKQHSDEALPVSWLYGRRIGAYCGIGNPASFESLLAAAGATVAASLRITDHGAASQEEWNAFEKRAEEAGTEAIVITEKDAVKDNLPVSSLPVYIFQVTFALDESEEFISQVLQKCGLNKK